MALPLVDQDRALGGIDHRRIRDEDLALSGVVELEDGVSSPGRRCCLADTPGALESERRQFSHEGVEFLVSDATSVFPTICRTYTLPLATTRRSHLPPTHPGSWKPPKGLKSLSRPDRTENPSGMRTRAASFDDY